MEAKCGDYTEVEHGYDARGNGTTYYRAICKKCGKGVNYSENRSRPVEEILLQIVCPDTAVERHRRALQHKIDHHKTELDRLNKEYLQSLKEHG